MTRHGFDPIETRYVNEGQGDLLVAGSIVLAGYGFRTDRPAHDEVAVAVGMRLVSLELVDPRFYHLDTALTVLDDTHHRLLPAGLQRRVRAAVARISFPMPSR